MLRYLWLDRYENKAFSKFTIYDYKLTNHTKVLNDNTFGWNLSI